MKDKLDGDTHFSKHREGHIWFSSKSESKTEKVTHEFMRLELRDQDMMSEGGVAYPEKG